MNAYELADETKKEAKELQEYAERWGDINNYFVEIMNQCADMLCQQADRIAELEKDLHMIERHYYQLNHPVKQLSDEEIDKIENKVYLQTIAKGKPLGNYSKQLARAIIKEITE